eukprot:g10727.t1
MTLSTGDLCAAVLKRLDQEDAARRGDQKNRKGCSPRYAPTTPCSGLSTESNKRARRAPIDLAVAPIPLEATRNERPTTSSPSEGDEQPPEPDAAALKMEPGVFSIGRRGSWM